MSKRAYTVRLDPTNELRNAFWWALGAVIPTAMVGLRACKPRGVPAWLKRYRLSAPWCRELALRQLQEWRQDPAFTLVSSFELDDPIPIQLATFHFSCRGWWPYLTPGVWFGINPQEYSIDPEAAKASAEARAGLDAAHATRPLRSDASPGPWPAEEWSEAEERIREQFDLALGRYRDKMRAAASARGWAAKRETEKHLRWLVRYLCGRESVYQIRTTLGEAVDKQTVTDAIRATADALGLEPPETPPPG